MADLPEAEVWLDERGRRCPAPVIALLRATTARPNTVIAVIADDPAAQYDIPAWCRLKGADFLGVADPPSGSGRAYYVRMPG